REPRSALRRSYFLPGGKQGRNPPISSAIYIPGVRRKKSLDFFPAHPSPEMPQQSSTIPSKPSPGRPHYLFLGGNLPGPKSRGKSEELKQKLTEPTKVRREQCKSPSLPLRFLCSLLFKRSFLARRRKQTERIGKRGKSEELERGKRDWRGKRDRVRRRKPEEGCE